MVIGFCACTPKLTTVPPSQVSEMRVERLSDGILAPAPTSREDEERQVALILQLESHYAKSGSCLDSAGHKYRVTLYLGDVKDAEVYLNEDNSVCKAGKRYVAVENAYKPVSISDWDALFGEKE